MVVGKNFCSTACSGVGVIKDNALGGGGPRGLLHPLACCHNVPQDRPSSAKERHGGTVHKKQNRLPEKAQQCI